LERSIKLENGPDPVYECILGWKDGIGMMIDLYVDVVQEQDGIVSISSGQDIPAGHMLLVSSLAAPMRPYLTLQFCR
jgi:hypothetical protein